MAVEKPIVVAFDFDDTLITRDTLADFLLHSFPLLVVLKNAILISPTILALALGLISNSTAKERLLALFLREMPLETFDLLGSVYARRLTKLARPAALARLRWHQEQGHKVLILSASVENWIRPWAKEIDVHEVIATQVKIVDGKLSGKLAGPNCHGPEKVRRFLAKYPDRSSYQLYVYGDGKSDKEMFLASDRFFKRTFS